MLFLCHSFLKHYHQKPKSYYELFEFCILKEMEGLVEEYMKRLREIQ